jgi:hypothetical protein
VDLKQHRSSESESESERQQQHRNHKSNIKDGKKTCGKNNQSLQQHQQQSQQQPPLQSSNSWTTPLSSYIQAKKGKAQVNNMLTLKHILAASIYRDGRYMPNKSLCVSCQNVMYTTMAKVTISTYASPMDVMLIICHFL